MASAEFYDLSILLYPLMKQQTEDRDSCGYICGLCVPVPVHESAYVISLVCFVSCKFHMNEYVHVGSVSFPVRLL